ncbi:MAG TPA: hypothetical protein PKC43_09645 [Phycisphaerales bacterium]|nr:hypothetical protein [Phycisphaerales bacterium]HMP37697.1 hypothetical protein [Phycisphaerales bacterium]
MTRFRVAPEVVAIPIALHLAMVALFVFTGYPGDRRGLIADGLRTWRNLAGIFRDYTFFAPRVATDTKVAFLVEREGGGSRVVTLDSPTREGAFRINCVVNACLRDERARDLFAQSWAAGVLGADPEAIRVSVLAMAFEIPTMAAYREGERPRWLPLYAGAFERRDRSAAAPRDGGPDEGGAAESARGPVP